MKEEMKNYFLAIGNVQRVIKNSKTLDEALENSIREILKKLPADYALLWYAEEREEGDMLFPYFWRGDRDFASCHHKAGEGLVGQVYESREPKNYMEYKAGMDESIDADFEGVEVASVLCVPFADDNNILGCIQFVQKEGSGLFDDEMADLLELLAQMACISLSENTNIKPLWKHNNILLSARDIKRSFVNGDEITTVLRGVNLDVYEGEFLVILGESGSGKSTFLNIIGGMDKADSGTINFMGKDLSDASQDELTKFRKDNIGFIFQSYNLISTFTAAQNVALIGELVDDHLSPEECLEMVGLGERKKNYPAQLSGGQQQRVSIARALVKKPKMIFADEPTSALDYSTSIEVLSVLENVVKNGTTLVMVTHNEEITRMADRVVRMRNGRTFDVTINRNPVHATDLVW